MWSDVRTSLPANRLGTFSETPNCQGAPCEPLTGVSAKTPFWRDVRVLKWVFQLVVLGVVIGVIFWLYSNYQINVQKSKIPTDLRFLDNPANFTFPGQDFDQSSPVRAAFIQGFYNTLRVSIVGILLAIFIGTLVGMARLSKNFLVRTVAGAYVRGSSQSPSSSAPDLHEPGGCAPDIPPN